MNQTTASTSTLDSIKGQISAGRFDQALPQLETLLAEDPRHADAHYMAAVCYRYQKNYVKSQSHLDILKDLSLDKGRVYQEQGHLYRAQNKPLPALNSYQTACQLNPALLASWQAQAQLLANVDRSANTQQIMAQLNRLQKLPKALISVMDLTAQGKLHKAEVLCKKFLVKNPTHVEAMRLLADIAMHLGAMEDADFLLESAGQLAPTNTQVQIDYIRVLRRRQKFTEALACSQKLLENAPKNPQFLSVLAIAKMQIGDYESAVSLFDQVLEKLPNDAITLTSRGHALKTWGKNKAAIDSYRTAIQCNKSYCEAFYALSNLKTYRFEDPEVDSMLSLENEPSLLPADKTYLYFALGKAFEDRQNWELAFNYYTYGNRIKKQQGNYSADSMSQELLDQRAFFSEQKINNLKKFGYPDPAPIFIVGLPRAGSTLLEQILSSHSMVDGTLELPNMLTIAQQLKRLSINNELPKYPEIIESLEPQELYDLGKQYIDETAIHRDEAPFFIDKMPNNFRHIGLIKILLPNAKIIDARRHPVGCCFSGFKQLFAEGQEFSYDLDDIARYYNDYVELMKHWDSSLPGEVLRVCYEEVTDNLEVQVRRILDYCELPFEASCLDFHKTKRAVRTASSEQVRQPINKQGVDQWRNFEQFLQPLIDDLGPSLADY